MNERHHRLSRVPVVRPMWGAGFTAIVSLGLSLAFAHAGDFEIGATPQGEDIAVTFSGSSSHYYQIWIAEELASSPFSLTAIRLGLGGAQTWIDYGVLASESTRRFYRVQQVPETAARDEDGDGMDTWFEFRHPFLDPLDGADGTRDFDLDGVINAREYLRRTDPSDPLSLNITLYGDGHIGDDAFDGFSPTVIGRSGPKRRIQAAIDAAERGDTLRLAAGRYSGNVVVTKDIALIPFGEVVIGGDR